MVDETLTARLAALAEAMPEALRAGWQQSGLAGAAGEAARRGAADTEPAAGAAEPAGPAAARTDQAGPAAAAAAETAGAAPATLLDRQVASALALLSPGTVQEAVIRHLAAAGGGGRGSRHTVVRRGRHAGPDRGRHMERRCGGSSISRRPAGPGRALALF